MKQQQAGMTLLELMIVVAVIGILAAIAYPSYTEQVRRSNRSEAKIALEERAQAFEKCYVRAMRYDAAACDNAATEGPIPSGRYTLSVDRNDTTFRVEATPQGGQANDTECAIFSITNDGTRGVSGTASAEPQRCWQR